MALPVALHKLSFAFPRWINDCQDDPEKTLAMLHALESIGITIDFKKLMDKKYKWADRSLNQLIDAQYENIFPRPMYRDAEPPRATKRRYPTQARQGNAWGNGSRIQKYTRVNVQQKQNHKYKLPHPMDMKSKAVVTDLRDPPENSFAYPKRRVDSDREDGEIVDFSGSEE